MQAKTRVRQLDWLKLAGDKIRREQVGTVPTFLSISGKKVAKLVENRLKNAEKYR